jgi:putative hydrolase of the HAD superfamily
VRPRAVVFDLWGTLVGFPRERSETLRARWGARLGVPVERLDELWNGAGSYEERESGPLEPVLRTLERELGGTTNLEDLLAWRLELARHALVPEPATIEALAELRRRGYRLGLLSNSTEDVAIVWPETDLAPLFDASVFSATAGYVKPDPRIYALVCDALEVPPADCLFVGDGANDELGGAERVGMTAVLLQPAGTQPSDGLARWSGLRAPSVSGVLELVE